MSQADLDYLKAAAGRIDKVLAARAASPLLPNEALSEGLRPFSERFTRLLEALDALRKFSVALANGNLVEEAPPNIHLLSPLKHLQSSLRHLTWQVQQIAAGDLDQQVDFLGEFSVAFNQMIEALREKRATEEKARYLSVHDSLTGLYNRTYFNEQLEQLREADNYPTSLVVADLDDLKTVNDTKGHLVGDLLIKKAAQVLQYGVHPADIVARIGGDEFVIILYGSDQNAAQTVVTQIRAMMDAHNRRDRDLPVSLSLGTSTAFDRFTLDQALRRADEAMYEDKLQRKNKSQIRHHRSRPGC